MDKGRIMDRYIDPAMAAAMLGFFVWKPEIFIGSPFGGPEGREPDLVVRCERCGRPCLHGMYEVGYDGGHYVCGDECLGEMVYDGELPHWWLDAE